MSSRQAFWTTRRLEIWLQSESFVQRCLKYLLTCTWFGKKKKRLCMFKTGGRIMLRQHVCHNYTVVFGDWLTFCQFALHRFVSRRQNTLLINSEADLAPKNRDLRHASPFLHDACCLHAMRFSEHSSSVLHRRVFEHVRLQMGQLMIASPLPLEELTGILIMALWASAPSVRCSMPTH